MFVYPLTAILAVRAVSACTFSMEGIHNYNPGDGSGGVSCLIRIYEGDLDADGIYDTDPDVTQSVGCADGSGGIDYKGYTYQFDWGSWGDAQIDEGSTITFQRVSGDSKGTEHNIYPDGDDKEFSNNSPWSQAVLHEYWLAGIECPQA